MVHQGRIEWAIPAVGDVAAGRALEVGDIEATSPSMRVEFHVASRSVGAATYLGILFMRSMKPPNTSESPLLIGG